MISPFSRCSGSLISIILVLRAKSIFRSFASIIFNSFFLAFIIFGNEMNLGLFNHRSTVTTQGNIVFNSSTPESISLFKKTSLSRKLISEIKVA